MTTKAPVPIRELRPDVPANLAAVLDRMLAKQPADRFATPAEVARALAPFAAASDLTRLMPAGGTAADSTPASVEHVRSRLIRFGWDGFASRGQCRRLTP